MHAFTQFSFLAIVFLVVAKPRAIERRYVVSGPEEVTPSFATVVSAKEVERSFDAVEPPQILAPRYSTAGKESEFHLFY